MIPKKIHYCWFGHKPFPKSIKKCISTWNYHLSDYEIKLWDEKNSPMSHLYIQQAYKEKKYAFVADYVRLWALYHEGGIYLDTDVYIIKNFNILLNEEVFFGFERQANDYINGAIIGAEAYNDFIYKLLCTYDNLKFENYNIDNLKIPEIITKTYSTYDNNDTIKIFPYDYFYPFPYEKRHKKNEFLSYKTEHTFAIHLWDFSWFNWKDYYFQKLHNLEKKIKL